MAIFLASDCELFARHPKREKWNDISRGDQDHYKDVRGRFKALVDQVLKKNSGANLKPFTSHPTPNGRSPTEIWCCLLPTAVLNKSYGLQVAAIISERGVEICLCFGAGESQVKNVEHLAAMESQLRSARTRLARLPAGLVATLESGLDQSWRYRRSWLTDPNGQEFSSLRDWLRYAASDQGCGSSISSYLTPRELDRDQGAVALAFESAVKHFRPLLDYVYSDDRAVLEPSDGLLFAALRELLRDVGEAQVVTSQAKLVSTEASLLAKPFLVLTGLSGSGKTMLAQALSLWLSVPTSGFASGTEKAERKPLANNVRLIPVGADWTSNENILGYPDGLDANRYVSTSALELILDAEAHSGSPYFLILDEMNLSHVERYFADFLSSIESGEDIPLYEGEPRKANGRKIPPKIELPKNLFVIGTVNVDETTYMFSPKVLDRANVIEFRMEADEMATFLKEPKKPDLDALAGKGARYGRAFVEAAKAQVDVPAEVADAFREEMLHFFTILQKHHAEYGYRTGHEAARFVHFYKELGGDAEGDAEWFREAMDCVIVQKLLPKLHGSRTKLGPLLKDLWHSTRYAPHERNAEQTDPNPDQLDKAHYPLSAEKVYRMWKLLGENGFASFAEA